MENVDPWCLIQEWSGFLHASDSCPADKPSLVHSGRQLQKMGGSYHVLKIFFVWSQALFVYKLLRSNFPKRFLQLESDIWKGWSIVKLVQPFYLILYCVLAVKLFLSNKCSFERYEGCSPSVTSSSSVIFEVRLVFCEPSEFHTFALFPGKGDVPESTDTCFNGNAM